MREGDWERDGFYLIRGFADPAVGRAMLERVVAITRQASGQLLHEGKLVLPENNLRDSAGEHQPAERAVSKVFKLHRDPVFQSFVARRDVQALVEPMLGNDLDCFLSQFIFKNPGAWGQPWHQDEFYFPFDRSPQVGLWLAVSQATLENGCLWVLPGSQREPVHEHVPDRRPNANYGYVEIVDHDMGAAVPVLMQPGDLLVFHSRLMHRSTDNQSDDIRAAMVFHFAEHGTVDHSGGNAVNDWMHVTPS
jgi:phytanoyl-CoA hydroxylase